MKTKLILLLIIITSIGAKAQINRADSTVQAITYWGLNESYTYEILQSKEKNEGDGNSEKDPMRSIVQISVIDSTANSYVVEWRFLKHEIANIDSIPTVRDLLNEKKYVYRTNEMGEFEELLNWEEVRDNWLATTKESLKIAYSSKSESERESLIHEVSSVWEVMMTKEYVEQKVIEPVNIFHTFFGGVYGLDEVKEADMEIPIPAFNLGNTTAQVEIWLDEIDFGNDIYTLCYEQKIAQEEIKKLMERFFKELSKNSDTDNNKEGLDEVLSAEWNYSVAIHIVFDNSGWPLDMVSKNNVNIGSSQQNKTLRIRMIDDYNEE